MDNGKENPQEVLNAMGITVESTFVPFSQSRDKARKMPSLNWRVTIKIHGRDVLTTDYSAGMAHCPGYAAKKVPHNFLARGYRRKTPDGYRTRAADTWESLEQYREALARAECESGVAMRLGKWGKQARIEPLGGRPGSSTKNRPINPDPCSVMYSLTMDSDALNSGGFENWARDFGYSPDSIKAKAIYDSCMELALQMLAGFGFDGLAKLQTAFQDY